jgi:hypothetical protein
MLRPSLPDMPYDYGGMGMPPPPRGPGLFGGGGGGPRPPYNDFDF